jgi:hypothetical protein
MANSSSLAGGLSPTLRQSDDAIDIRMMKRKKVVRDIGLTKIILILNNGFYTSWLLSLGGYGLFWKN